METDRMQVNFRIDKEMADLLDQRRVALMAELGKIPTRSEVFRIALKQYLENTPTVPSQEVKRERTRRTKK
jgi:metal-responsive CopG/Arc/MetJ family transcriptional regulator